LFFTERLVISGVGESPSVFPTIEEKKAPTVGTHAHMYSNERKGRGARQGKSKSKEAPTKKGGTKRRGGGGLERLDLYGRVRGEKKIEKESEKAGI
jgi:hypothetical protein